MINKQNLNNKLNGYLLDNKDLSSLSTNLQEKIKNWDILKEHISRPSWAAYFMAHAFIAATRSVDASTKHGCVLVNKYNRIIAEGYNSFIRGIDDRILPNAGRPDKYRFMIHSEENAIIDCATQGKSTMDATAYITGPPCFSCMQKMWQAGINRVYYGKRSSKMIETTEYQEDLELFKYLTLNNMPMIELDFDEKDAKEILY